jgi:3-phenylpropionate/trans-cinnamate dioxygenase ferredoxin component
MSATIMVCPVGDLPIGAMKLIAWEGLEILVANCGGTFHAIEDRCSHDNGPLHEGRLDESACTVECPRHGSIFALSTGRPLCLPAYEPVETFPVRVEDEKVLVEVE